MSDVFATESLSVLDDNQNVTLSPSSLSMRPHEILGVLGPNGSGKSTLLRAISGMIPHTGMKRSGRSLLASHEGRVATGRIVVDGDDVSLCQPSERRIGLIRQDAALLPYKSALENIALPGIVQGEKQEALKAARELGCTLGLEKWLDKPATQLSGGVQRRVSYARALLSKPSVLLCDEPCANLDIDSREQFLELIRSMTMELEMAVILVSHDPDEIAQICDRVAFLDAGKIEQIDSWKKAWESPKTEFVARMTGRNIILNGKANSDRYFYPQGCVEGVFILPGTVNIQSENEVTEEDKGITLVADSSMFEFSESPEVGAVPCSLINTWFQNGKRFAKVSMGNQVLVVEVKATTAMGENEQSAYVKIRAESEVACLT